MKWRFVKIALGSIVGVPLAAGGGLAVYVSYRAHTRPPDPIFRPLVNADGSLILSDSTRIAPPSRLSILVRIVELLMIFLPMAVLYLLMSHRSAWKLTWMKMMLRAVEHAGPAFIKAGQWTCTRKDLFSDEFREVFQRLYCEVQIHPYRDTLRILREDLGCDPMTIFSSLEVRTVGSGSIGQVHAAILKDTSEKVVVKVMHPRVIETISQDFFIVNSCASLVAKYFSSLERYDLKTLALAWTNHLAAQLDFRIEAENLELFRDRFKDVDFVEFPRPILSTQRVLVETYANGVPATPDFLRAQETHVRDIMAFKGLNTWCKMLLRDNFIHGDMHPGNILVDASNPHKPVITLIDVGLCQKLTSAESVVYHDLMSSFVHWDPALCAKTTLSMYPTQKFCDEKKFKHDIDFMFTHYRSATSTDHKVVTNILESVFSCVRDNHIMLDTGYVSLMFAVLVLEAFIMNLNPEFNMVRHSAPWLVSEGHLSWSLVRNIFLSKVHQVRTDWTSNVNAKRYIEAKALAEKNVAIRMTSA